MIFNDVCLSENLMTIYANIDDVTVPNLNLFSFDINFRIYENCLSSHEVLGLVARDNSWLVNEVNYRLISLFYWFFHHNSRTSATFQTT